MPLYRNLSTRPLTVPGAGLAQPGGLLEVPPALAAGLGGPEWRLEPQASPMAPAITPGPSPAPAPTTPPDTPGPGKEA